MIDPEHIALRTFLEQKNAEVRDARLEARIGNLNGSRVVAVREVLAGWSPDPGTPLAALWQQVKDATELYADQIARIVAADTIPGIDPTA